MITELYTYILSTQKKECTIKKTINGSNEILFTNQGITVKLNFMFTHTPCSSLLSLVLESLTRSKSLKA